MMILWQTLVSVVLSFTYHEWIYFKNRKIIQLRKDAGCDIRKPILDSCLLFAKEYDLGVSFNLAVKWE